MTVLDSLLQIILASTLSLGVLQTQRAIHETVNLQEKLLITSAESLTSQGCEVQGVGYLHCRRLTDESPFVFYFE